jgi:hypothetical protein
VIAPADGDDEDREDGVIDPINQPLPSLPQLDLVVVRHPVEGVRSDARTEQAFGKLLLELDAKSIAELAPFLLGRGQEGEAIAHRA